MIDFLLIAAVMVSGILEAPWIVMPVAAGALATSPIWRLHAVAREKPHIDSRQILRELTLDATLYAMAVVIGAYLVGLVVGRFMFPEIFGSS